MKNFLIPTTFHQDTIEAIKNAIHYADGNASTITLLLVHEIPDTFSSIDLMRTINQKWTVSQEKVKKACQQILLESSTCSLKIHNQYGISSPLVKNLLDFLSIDLIILTPSFKTSSNSLHPLCSQILANYKYPILHITTNSEEANYNKAIYLENEKSLLEIEDLQALVQKQFSLKIVSKVKYTTVESSQELKPMLAKAIAKNEFDIIIETRKPEKIKKSKKKTIHEILDLPILSIYENVH